MKIGDKSLWRGSEWIQRGVLRRRWRGRSDGMKMGRRVSVGEKVELARDILGREVVVEARRIRSEKLREHQYREGYVRSLEGKGVE